MVVFSLVWYFLANCYLVLLFFRLNSCSVPSELRLYHATVLCVSHHGHEEI